MEFLKNAENRNFTVWHNGSNVLSCTAGKEVLDYIAYILNLYLDGDPRLIVDKMLDVRTETGGECLLLVYEYIDMFRDFFFIESGEAAS
ncbi:MAG: hypothetical protein K2P44_04495 [Lachnospiraceae bacterium]|nr:hypothetical protein [Lachnospiraceae bacterium]